MTTFELPKGGNPSLRAGLPSRKQPTKRKDRANCSLHLNFRDILILRTCWLNPLPPTTVRKIVHKETSGQILGDHSYYNKSLPRLAEEGYLFTTADNGALYYQITTKGKDAIRHWVSKIQPPSEPSTSHFTLR